MKLTQKIVSEIKAGEDPSADEWIWDDHLRGFAVRRRGKNQPSFWVCYRLLNGSKRKKLLGLCSEIRLDDARAAATDIILAARAGIDRIGQAREERAARLTVADLAREHQALHCPPAIGHGTFVNNRGYWKNHILPVLGSKVVSELSVQDVKRLHLKLGDRPVTANRVLTCLSKALSDCELWTPAWRPRGSNPCQFVAEYPEADRQEILEPEDLGRLLDTLEALKAEWPMAEGTFWSAPYLFEILLLSGLRLREWACAEWAWVDMRRGTLTVPRTKTQRNFVSHLSDEVLEILAAMPKPTRWIFPNATHTGPLRWPKDVWKRVKARAGVAVRIHDLRHTFASYAHTDAGLSNREVGALLGHSNTSTTDRYLNVLDRRKKAANNRGASAVKRAHSLH